MSAKSPQYRYTKYRYCGFFYLCYTVLVESAENFDNPAAVPYGVARAGIKIESKTSFRGDLY